MDRRTAASLLCLLPASATLLAGDAAPVTDAELQRWFEDDSEIRAAQVSEGELRFLPDRPSRDDGRPLPHSENRLTLTPASLTSGWVSLEQCHHGLDAVAEAQVVYRYRQMRGLSITESSRIGRTWVAGDSVQLLDVQRDARLCISTEVRILYPDGEGRYRLVNGPYHRKFLDGYYPYHVSLDVRFDRTGLRYQDMRPTPRPGLWVTPSAQGVTVDAWFEGMLNTELRFRAAR